MPKPRRPWQEELALVDQAMRRVSDVTEPNELVQVYWDAISDLMPQGDYLALSRRGVEAPEFLVTRSSRFTEHFNPWTQRHMLPRLSGGLLEEIAYADRPVVIDDLPARLRDNDPGHFYLRGYEALLAAPQYEGGKGINIGLSLFERLEDFDPERAPMMHWQASLFGRGTQSLVLRNQLQAALSALDREVQVVGEIQRSLLPRELPSPPGFEFAAYYRTSARAGGDYYDFFPLEEGNIGIFIADVSGHGTPAAVLMAITHAIAHTRPGNLCPPREVLAHLNDHLARSYTTDGAFITAFYASLNPRTGRLTYATAGHNPPRLRRQGTIHSLDGSPGLPLGIFGNESFGESSIQLERGDLLLLYTDGITEATLNPGPSAPLDLFGVQRLDSLLCGHPNVTAQQCVDLVRDSVDAFAQGGSPSDDQTLIAVRYMG